MKYFVLGALACGFLLYGLSMMYGATGTLEIPASVRGARTGADQQAGAGFGLVFIVAGLAFKLGRRRSTCGCPTSTRAHRRRSRC